MRKGNAALTATLESPSRTRPLFTGGEELEEKQLPPICSVAVAGSQSVRTAAELAPPSAGTRGRRQGGDDEYLPKRREKRQM